MAKKNYFTQDEIVLCTYAAMYEINDFGDSFKIETLTHRSKASISMKIQNIAAMLDEANIQRYNKIKALTGLPQGQSGRKTNWDIVVSIYKLPKQEFLKKCLSILNAKSIINKSDLK